MREEQIGRMQAIAALVRIHGPHKAVKLVKEADAAHAEGRAPNWMMLLEDLSAKAERDRARGVLEKGTGDPLEPAQ